MKAYIDLGEYGKNKQYFIELIGHDYNSSGYNSWERVVLFNTMEEALEFQKELNSLDFKHDEYNIGDNILPPLLEKELGDCGNSFLDKYPSDSYDIYILNTNIACATDADIRKAIIDELLIDTENEDRT